MALLVVGVAVPTPGAVGGFHEAFRIGATTFFGAPDDAAVGAAIVLHVLSIGPVAAARAVLRGAGGLNVAGMRRLADQDAAQSRTRDAMKCPVLRPSRRQGRRLAREQGRRSHSPAPRVPRVRQALHQLRADRRDPVHGGEEGRHARAVRAAEADRRPAEGVREAAGERRGARGRRRPRRSRRCRSGPRRRSRRPRSAPS